MVSFVVLLLRCQTQLGASPLFVHMINSMATNKNKFKSSMDSYHSLRLTNVLKYNMSRALKKIPRRLLQTVRFCMGRDDNFEVIRYLLTCFSYSLLMLKMFFSFRWIIKKLNLEANRQG